MQINYKEYETNGARVVGEFIVTDVNKEVDEKHHDKVLEIFDDEYGDLTEQYKELRAKELLLVKEKSQLLVKIKSTFKNDFQDSLKVKVPELFV